MASFLPILCLNDASWVIYDIILNIRYMYFIRFIAYIEPFIWKFESLRKLEG